MKSKIIFIFVVVICTFLVTLLFDSHLLLNLLFMMIIALLVGVMFLGRRD